MAGRRNKQMQEPREIDWNRENLRAALRIHEEMEAQEQRNKPANPMNLGRPLSKDEVRAMLANSPRLD